MPTEIYQFVNDAHNQRIGVIMGTKLSDNQVIVTSSKVNKSHGDIFDRERGISIARARVRKHTTDHGQTHAASFELGISEFTDRCKKYFKVNYCNIN